MTDIEQVTFSFFLFFDLLHINQLVAIKKAQCWLVLSCFISKDSVDHGMPKQGVLKVKRERFCHYEDFLVAMRS